MHARRFSEILMTLLVGMSCMQILFAAKTLPDNNDDERSGATDGPQEYCLNEENFEAKCHKNEIIVVKSATYGRMRIGRCLESERQHLATMLSNDPSVLGCSVDVVYLVNRKCVGQNHCEIRMQDPDLKKEKPCLPFLQKYLEVDYDCVTVVEEDRGCVIFPSSNPLHIMRSSSADKLHCGTKSQPWRLEAPAGRQINISLLDYGSKVTESLVQQQNHHCPDYGYIIDKSAKKNVSICRLSQGVGDASYKSQSNQVEIYLNAFSGDHQESAGGDNKIFLLRLIAIGCSDLVPPDDAWLRRNDNEAVVGCYTSRQTWYLHCTGNIWFGVIGNCTRDLDVSIIHQVEAVKHPDGVTYQVVVIVAIGFLALIICLTLICCAAVCLRRYYTRIALKYSRKVEEIEKYKYFNAPATDNTESKNGILVHAATGNV